MDDVGQELTARGEFLPWLYSQNQPFYDLVYADDTALIAGTAQRAEQLLHILQRVAAHSNLHLNRKKCVLHTCRKGTQALQLAAPVLAQHRPHTEVEVTNLQWGATSNLHARPVSSVHALFVSNVHAQRWKPAQGRGFLYLQGARERLDPPLWNS